MGARLRVSDRVAYLDGIRAIAIGAVLLVHWGAPLAQSIFPGASLARGGYIGVDIFFVVSGYIITTMLWKKPIHDSVLVPYRRFIWRRVVRLYPALVGLVVVGTVVYSLIPGSAGSSSVAAAGVIALVQGSSFYAALQVDSINPFGITWSLSVEWMFYLLWPLAVFTAKKAGMEQRRFGLLSVGIAVALYGVALCQDERWFYFGALARIPELMAGGALALLLLPKGRREGNTRYPKASQLIALALILAAAGYTLLGPAQWSQAFRFVGLPLSVAVGLYLIWIGLRAPGSLLVRVLSCAPLAWLGRVSYSLYLWHSFAFDLLLDRDIPLPIFAFLAVLMAAALTWLSYRFLEQPFLRHQGASLQPAEPGDPKRLVNS